MADRALITGSEGFLGRAVRAAFRDVGLSTHGIGRRPSGAEPYSSIDLRAEDATRELQAILAVLRPRWLVHIAGVPGATSFSANVEPIRTVVAALQGSGLPLRLLAIGSAAEYGDQGPDPIAETVPAAPVSAYGVAKLAATHIALQARDRGFDVTVARVFNVLGPGMSDDLAPQAFLKSLSHSGSVLESRGSEAVRDYLEVHEVARALVALAIHPSQLPAIVNVCSGKGTRMGDLFVEAPPPSRG